MTTAMQSLWRTLPIFPRLPATPSLPLVTRYVLFSFIFVPFEILYPQELNTTSVGPMDIDPGQFFNFFKSENSSNIHFRSPSQGYDCMFTLFPCTRHHNQLSFIFQGGSCDLQATEQSRDTCLWLWFFIGSQEGERLKHPQRYVFYCLYIPTCYLFRFIFIDPLAGLLPASDYSMIVRARNVISDSIMAEIAKEDPLGQTEFENTVRHHVVAFSQRIHVSLLVLDKLMEIYNSSKKD